MRQVYYQYPRDNKIALMPIPSSKGLEFDTVIILDISFCHKDKEQDEDISLSDDIRRLYVGMTRAQNHLIISHHRNSRISEALKNTDI